MKRAALICSVVLLAGCGQQPPSSTTAPSAAPPTLTTATASTSPSATSLTAPLGPPAGPVINHAVDASCGTELWAIKTLTDAGAARVKPTPQTITGVAQLNAVSDKGAGATTRVGIELRVYRITAQLVEAKQEPDSDLHVILRDAAGKTLVTEFPAAQCVRDAKPVARDDMNAARQAFVSSCGQPPTTSFKQLTGSATVLGVGFYDRDHGQTARDSLGDGFDIELHPIIGFSGGCRR